MKNEMMIFKNEEFGQIRTMEMDGKTYFAANDILKSLGYAEGNWRTTISRKCKGVAKCNVPHPQNFNKEIEMNFITEGDVYRLIASSKLPSAEKFESWVFDEVLPDIRKHGMYATDNTIDNMLNNPDFAITLLTKYKEEKEERKRLEQENREKEELLKIAGEKTSIYDSFINSDGLYSINDVSKTLGINKLGRNNFYKYLRDNKILMIDTYIDYKGVERPGLRHYEAYAQYTNSQQYFIHRQREVQIRNMKVKQNVAMFTPKGVEWIIKRLQKDGYIAKKDLNTIIEELKAI